LKKIFVLITLAIMLLCNTAVYAEYSGDSRHIVLVLETSEGSEFTFDGELAYTASSPINYTKQAAKKFVNNILLNDSNTKIAIVSYNSDAENVTTFTNNINILYSAIDRLYSKSKNKISITAGLQIADNLLNEVNGKKDVVLLTTGMSYGCGNYSYSGKYDNSVAGSTWHMSDTNVHIYAYANESHKIADKIKKSATIYTVGVFQTMNNAPETVKPIATFFRLFTKDLASNAKNFYSIENIDNLSSAFENVANEIQNPSVAYSFDVKNISNPSTPKEGKANINKEQWTGDVFEFTAITSQNVNEISICGDKPDETLWHEISYSFLKDNYGLSHVDNYDGTRTWKCQFGIHEIGYRSFLLRINGHDTDFVTHATLYENNGSFSPTPQQGNISVVVNGEYVNFDVQPQIINGRTMIPLRAVAESFGAEVDWYEESQSIRIRGKYPKSDYLHYWLELEVGRDLVSWVQFNSDYTERLSDGNHIYLDSPPVVVNGRTLVPIRAIAELLWLKVEWNDATKTVYIYE